MFTLQRMCVDHSETGTWLAVIATAKARACAIASAKARASATPNTTAKTRASARAR